MRLVLTHSKFSLFATGPRCFSWLFSFWFVVLVSGGFSARFLRGFLTGFARRSFLFGGAWIRHSNFSDYAVGSFVQEQ